MDASLTDRASFRIWTQERARYADTDRQGHVNNAVFATFCESGRVAFLYDGDASVAGPGLSFVIARLVLDFRAELLYRDVVDIGTRIQEIRRSSLILGQGLFRGETCVATSEAAIVLVDEATRRSTLLPDALRQKLLSLSGDA
jgi:acyl-CoA thioester hydrolase